MLSLGPYKLYIYTALFIIFYLINFYEYAIRNGIEMVKKSFLKKGGRWRVPTNLVLVLVYIKKVKFSNAGFRQVYFYLIIL